MGALVSKAMRPIKSVNIENRAHRVISKEKPTPAPTYPSTYKELERAAKANPNLDETLSKKDLALDERLRNVYVTSKGRPEEDVTKERQATNKLLPQDRRTVPTFDYGFKEPERITYGRTTIRNAMTFISSHQVDPKEASVEKIAFEYKLKEEDVQSILKYFKVLEVFVPATKSSPATITGPAQVRKDIEQNEAKKLLDIKESMEIMDKRSSVLKNTNMDKEKNLDKQVVPEFEK